MWRVSSFLMVLVVALAACAPAAPQAGQPASGKPAGGKPAKTEIVVSTASDAVTINPMDNNIITPDFQIGLNMYDPLVDLDADGKLQPALATSWERLSPTTIRFKLRQGVKFHDGEDFTAEDVKFTFDTVLDPARKHKWASTQGYVERAEVVDTYTVDLITKKPEALALRKLHRQGIASTKYARENPDILNTKPNGTGSYRFVEWVKDTRLVMEAFESGWRGVPAIKRVTWRPIKEDAARVAALVAGEIDLAHSVPFDLAPQIEKSGIADVRPVAGMRSYWLMLVNTKPELPTAKKEVRQAINYAINRDELNKELFSGQALTMATAVHPKSLGYKPELKWPYDPNKAKELLARAGYPNGFTIGFHGSDGRYARDRELSHAIAGQLAKVGISVQVTNYEVGQFADRIFNKQTDPLVLYAFSDSERDRTGTFSVSHRTGQLWSVFSHPELDAFINKAESTLEDAERAGVMHEVQDWMMEYAPAAYLLTLVDVYGVNNAVKWQPRPDDTMAFREATWSN
jgi:peptide/nickel transport system substrate-binding protein